MRARNGGCTVAARIPPEVTTMTRPLPHLLVLALGLAAASAAVAAEPPEPAAAPGTERAVEQDHEVDRNCLRHTGSRLLHSRRARAEKRCAPAFGRVYTQDDLRMTGAVDIADALRRLDPAIR
jgi:hypothetical protein